MAAAVRTRAAARRAGPATTAADFWGGAENNTKQTNKHKQTKQKKYKYKIADTR
jgi:hypothetical protein